MNASPRGPNPTTFNHFRWLRKVLLFLLVTGLAPVLPKGSVLAQDQPQVKRIWDQGKHNAFTDLIHFDNHFVCTFRESAAHVPRNHQQDGVIRLIRSRDGKDWENWHVIRLKNVDLRDPKLSLTPAGKLMVLAGGSYYESGKLLKRIPYVVFYDSKSEKWSEPKGIVVDKAIATPFDWLWRVTWHQGTAYGVIYQYNQKPWGLHLVSSKDGIHYENLKTLKLEGRPNESTIRFDSKGRMNIVVRNEDTSVRGHIGISTAPFKDWKWARTEQRLGGPNFVFLPSGQMILGTRHYGHSATTVLANIQKDGTIRRMIDFPSGGDTSYPGMILHEGRLYFTYYSSHQGKSNIYFYQQSVKAIEQMSKHALKPAAEKFTKHQFKDGNQTLNYRLLSPKREQENKKYPLVIFMHGAGERGSDNTAQLVHGMNDFASKEIMEKYPAFVFAPQCPSNKMWANTDWSKDSHEMTENPSETMQLVIQMIDQLIAEKPIDTDRIYVTGLSMGGFGTWDLISRHPDRFAAAAPICGGGDSRKKVVEKIKQIPIWVVHGDSDRAVKPKRSKDMVAALKAVGGKPKFTLMKNTGHDSWSKTYRDPRFYEWLFKQKR